MRALGVLLLSLIVTGLVWAGLYYFRDGQRPAEPIGYADLVRVDKSERRMELLRDGEVIRSYTVSLGRNPTGHKQREGDERTPEGRYVIDWRKPDSQFHKALHISYPNAQDRRAAAQKRVPPGGAIMIHGSPNGYDWAAPFIGLVDWTDGCIAVGDAEMEEIWEAVRDGTPIEITP